MAASDPAAAGGAADVADTGALPVHRLQPHDAYDVWPLSIEAGWNQLAADWQLMIAAGSAFGIQDAAGRWIASALALPLGPQVSWVSMVLVTKPERRHGHGTRLLKRCIAAIEAAGRVAGLDATEFGRPVYLPLGFRDVCAISRWSVPSAVEAPTAVPPGISIRPGRSQDLAKIVDYDRRCSGFERRTILENLLARAPCVAHVAERADGKIVGYSLGRDGYRAIQVGPVIAEDQTVGLALVSRALAGAHGPAILDLPDQHGSIKQWLQSQGASAPRSFMRMLRGSAIAVDNGSRTMAIAGPELA
jgi:GNAT superfamily N-acetyltransferase